jgi:predicted nucleic acid-binding protein
VIGLADTSAWTTRHRDPRVEATFDGWVREDLVAICDVVRFELLVSARDHAHFALMRERLDVLTNVAIDPRVWRRALDVFELFARQGPLHHRRVPFLDLLIAAAAERAELPVLHYDRDFELIAVVTGQPVRAIAPLGSLG